MRRDAEFLPEELPEPPLPYTAVLGEYSYAKTGTLGSGFPINNSIER